MGSADRSPTAPPYRPATAFDFRQSLARLLSYSRHRFPPAIIQHAIWLYLRFTLSYRDVEDLLAERGLEVSLDAEMVEIAGAIIRQRTGNFDPSAYRDRYQEAQLMQSHHH